MRTAILFGGRSGEHDVSCASATSVLRHIDRTQFEPIAIGIDRNGAWYVQSLPDAAQLSDSSFRLEVTPSSETAVVFDPVHGLIAGGRNLAIEAVFPVLHGTFGEDGTVQGLLELLNLPYVGSGVLGSSLSMDKHLTKQMWEHHGLPIVPYLTLHAVDYYSRPDHWIHEIENSLGIPAFIKPARGGSSVGVYKAHDQAELREAIQGAFRFDSKVLVEQSITAIEVECSVLGNSNPTAFEPASIEPSHEYYDYEAKYNDPDGAHFNIPAKIPPAITSRIQTTAVKAFRAGEARGLSRVDFFYCPDSNRLYLNEINTMPGFTAISLFPRMCEYSGIPYAELINTLIGYAVEEHKLRNSLLYTWQ